MLNILEFVVSPIGYVLSACSPARCSKGNPYPLALICSFIQQMCFEYLLCGSAVKKRWWQVKTHIFAFSQGKANDWFSRGSNSSQSPTSIRKHTQGKFHILSWPLLLLIHWPSNSHLSHLIVPDVCHGHSGDITPCLLIFLATYMTRCSCTFIMSVLFRRGNSLRTGTLG